jgi:hypothetical protein
VKIMPTNRPRPPRTVKHPDMAAQLRALEAINLRNAGMSLDEVAARCGYSDRGAAFHAIEREAGRMSDHETAKRRRMEDMRLDEYLQVYHPKALKGDGWSLDRCLNIMALRAKYWGLFMDRGEQAALMPYQKRIVLEDGPPLLNGPSVDGEVAS